MTLKAANIAFNTDSVRLQRAAGVDPDLCLKLAIVPGDARTELGLFFSALQKRIWATPTTGDWSEHDIKLHWPGVRSLHPQSVDVVIWAAAIGSEHLENSERAAAESMASALDFFIDKGSSEHYYDRVVELCKVDPGTAPDYTIQAQHAARIKQLEVA